MKMCPGGSEPRSPVAEEDLAAQRLGAEQLPSCTVLMVKAARCSGHHSHSMVAAVLRLPLTCNS